MFWCVLLLLTATLSATVLTWLYVEAAAEVDASDLPIRLIGGLATAVLLLPLLGYLLAGPVGLGPLADILLVGFVLLPFCWFKQPLWRARLQASLAPWREAATWSEHAPVLLAGLVLVVTLLVLFPEAVYPRQEANDPPDSPSIYTGDYSNLGDLPFHCGIAESFLRGGNFPPQDVELAGNRLAYPFLVDFGTAQLASLGASLTDAMTVQNCWMAIALFVTLSLLATAYTGDRRAGAITPWLVLFSGGLGFTMLFQEGHSFSGTLALLPHLSNSYTIRDNTEWRWPNAVTALLMPQRSLLLGLPTMIWIGYLMWRMVGQPAGLARTRLGQGAGLLTAALVLGHTYAALLIGVAGLVLAGLCWEPVSWGWYLGSSSLLAAPQMLWLALGMHAGGFVGWAPGWDHGTVNILVFWLHNMGIFLPVLVLALVLPNGEPHRTRLRFAAPFLGMFVVGNLIRLAPWLWDNVKVLFPAFVFCAPWVAGAVAWVSRRGRAGLAVSGALMLLLCASGMLDVWRIMSQAGELRIFTGEQVAFADQVAQAVPAQAVVLHAPTYDSALYLAGCLALEGYPGHMWSRGLEPGTREADIRTMYTGYPPARDLLSRYRVGYIAVTPQEQETYPINEALLSTFRQVVNNGGYHLYEVVPQH